MAFAASANSESLRAPTGSMKSYPSYSGAFSIRPATEHLGADLLGIDLREAIDNDQTMHEIRTALNRHLVLRIHQQTLSPAEAVRLTAFFGPVMDVRRPNPPAVHIPGYPEIQVLSNALDDQGRRVGDGSTEQQIWHSDAMQWEVPPGTVLFYGRKAPTPAPKTGFLNMIKAHAALPQAMKDRIASLRARNHMYPQAIEIDVHRFGKTMPYEVRAKGVLHPLVRRHIWTQQPMLYIPQRRDSLIEGLSEEESKALLTELWDFVDALPFTWAVAVDVDDVVIWDNAATVHNRESWPGNQDRIMWHLVAEGECPTPALPPKTPNFNGPTQLAY